jgi:YidC/Oxa1 family membrane protein insertase
MVAWEVVETTADPAAPGVNSAVTFRYPSPDGKLEVVKRYSLNKVEAEDPTSIEVRDSDSLGYQLVFELIIRNLGDRAQDLSYLLQGPVGVPLENAPNTRKYRDVKMGYFRADDEMVPIKERKVVADSLTAAALVKAIDKDETPEWKSALKYVGIDSQYFAAFLLPQTDPLKEPYLAAVRPEVLNQKQIKLLKEPNWADISIVLESESVTLGPAGGQQPSELNHTYTVFFGPKREGLLSPLGASSVIDYGWFGFVSEPMLGLLTLFHDFIPNYGIAIILLTVVVRGGMYPLSRKQVKNAQVMKELQPKIAELKKKYAKDKEKFARAQFDLFHKYKHNPFAGCLPMLVQLPIFIGLYQGLSNSVDLRLASFLWIDNLAAPDALFPLGFTVPFVGWTEFNLLPILTIVLFIAQQKMFMPPAAPDDEQAQMTQKMMKYMMVFMGFMFYRVPAGLCVYFIASSLWGLCERQLLDRQKKTMADKGLLPDLDEASEKRPDGNQDDDEPRKKGFLAKLVASAEAAAEQSKGAQKSSNNRNGNRSQSSKKKKKGSRR